MEEVGCVRQRGRGGMLKLSGVISMRVLYSLGFVPKLSCETCCAYCSVRIEWTVIPTSRLFSADLSCKVHRRGGSSM